MGYWKTKVLPKIKKVFEKNGTKKAAAAEAIKSFDESKVLCTVLIIFTFLSHKRKYVYVSIYICVKVLWY